MSQREQYTKQKLYEEAFNVCFNWEQFLTPRCFEFHDLTCRETNSPIPLQMGVMLPFVSACLGPTTRGCFLTRPSVLNLFWLNVAASGVGKSETRKRLISEPLEYIFSQPECHISDFEVSKFTRAGIEDKLITTNGYCIMITDEGASFLSDLRRYETKHESYISLLNQLFDGKGDKMTLAKNVERPVPRNSTSISIGVQQKSYCDAIHGLTETLWLDNGFSERFIFTAARPYRHKWKTNKEAAKKLLSLFDENIVGKVLHGILMHHYDACIKYELSPDAEDLFEEIVDNYNSQFNLKYSTSSSQISASQPELDTSEREDIFVRTKAAELVGRVACVLSIYCNAFESIATGKQLHIPHVISADYVRHAENIINTSYIQSEKFSSAIFSQQQSGQVQISKPKPSDRERVVHGIIRSCGIAVTVRTLAKNVKKVCTDALKFELRKLQDEGYVRFVDRKEMQNDKLFPANNCFSALVKKDVADLPDTFFQFSVDPECNRDMYTKNYDKKMDIVMKQVTAKYHDGGRNIFLSVPSDISDSSARNLLRENNMQWQHRRGHKTPMRTKLDSLFSNEEDNENDALIATNVDDADYASSDEDVEDLVFRKAVLPTRTGDFDLDFPPSPNVPKGGKNKSKKGDKAVNTSPQPTGSANCTPKRSAIERDTLSDDDIANRANSISVTTENVLQPNNEVETSIAPDLDLLGNIRASGVVSSQKESKKTKHVTDTHNQADAPKGINEEIVEELSTDGLLPSNSNNIADVAHIDKHPDNSSSAVKSCEVKRRTNAHGQVKTSRNCSRPKPPLPPMKEKKNCEPVRRSSRQKEIKEKEKTESDKENKTQKSQNVSSVSRKRRAPATQSQSKSKRSKTTS